MSLRKLIERKRATAERYPATRAAILAEANEIERHTIDYENTIAEYRRIISQLQTENADQERELTIRRNIMKLYKIEIVFQISYVKWVWLLITNRLEPNSIPQFVIKNAYAST